jgi:hypothetical protein
MRFNDSASLKRTESRKSQTPNFQLSTFSETDQMLVLTNAPWLLQGESERVKTPATSAFPVVFTGVTGD